MTQAKDHDLLDKHLGQTFASIATCMNRFVQQHMVCPSGTELRSGKKRKRDSLTLPFRAEALSEVRHLQPIAEQICNLMDDWHLSFCSEMNLNSVKVYHVNFAQK